MRTLAIDVAADGLPETLYCDVEEWVFKLPPKERRDGFCMWATDYLNEKKWKGRSDWIPEETVYIAPTGSSKLNPDSLRCTYHANRLPWRPSDEKRTVRILWLKEVKLTGQINGKLPVKCYC